MLIGTLTEREETDRAVSAGYDMDIGIPECARGSCPGGAICRPPDHRGFAPAPFDWDPQAMIPNSPLVMPLRVE